MDYFALRPIFGIMGAAIKIQVRPMEVYLLYPMILLLLVFPAALFIAGSVKKIDIREMNNLE
jgi:putative ABC transport system permease protein